MTGSPRDKEVHQAGDRAGGGGPTLDQALLFYIRHEPDALGKVIPQGLAMGTTYRCWSCEAPKLDYGGSTRMP